MLRVNNSLSGRVAALLLGLATHYIVSLDYGIFIIATLCIRIQYFIMKSKYFICIAPYIKHLVSFATFCCNNYIARS